MTERPLGPPLRSLAEVLDEVRLHDELEEMQAMDPAELDRQLAEAGYDATGIAERIAAAREAAYAAPVAAPAPAPAPPSKVVDLAAVRAKRAPATRWGMFSAAAILLLAVGASSARYAAHVMPAMTVEYPANSRPPTAEQLAAPWRNAGLRRCAMGYYGECSDLLDEAEKVDPEGEKSAAVKAARQAIEGDVAAKKPGHGTEYLAKPPVGPQERPLQPRH